VKKFNWERAAAIVTVVSAVVGLVVFIRRQANKPPQ
jgi:hypothetical protein